MPRRRVSRPALTARNADKHDLYQRSVQVPEADIRLVERMYQRLNGELPRVLREDFCGTALMASRWVAHREGNRAIAVDLDPEPLAWGERMNRQPLGAHASRLQLVRGDVRTVRVPHSDVTLAMNFSFYCFKERRDLVGYFRRARAGLKPGGLLLADAFGGPEAMEVLTERRRRDGFTYIWDQASFDSISHDIQAHIHFEFPDGSRLRRAFSYDWRLWGLPEIRDALAEAGFASVRILWETVDKKGRGTGVFREAVHADPCESWVCCIVAQR